MSDEGFAGLPEQHQPRSGMDWDNVRDVRIHARAAEARIVELEAENAALRAERDQWKFGRMADHTGHMFRCAKVNGKWTCAKDCAMARLTALEEALTALEQQWRRWLMTRPADELADLRARLTQEPPAR